MFAYLLVFVLVQFFRRTSSRRAKSIRLKEVIQTMSSHVKRPRSIREKFDYFNGEKKGNSRRREANSFITFPWWLKIILYSVSLTLMALSSCLVAFRGKCLFISSKYQKTLFSSIVLMI